MGDPDTDITWVKALQSGDEEALHELMVKYQQPIHRYIYRSLLNEQDALEATQEVFVRVYFKIHQFTPKAKFSTWLFQIATNLCRDHLRSRAFKEKFQTDPLALTNSEGDETERPLLSCQKSPSESLQANERLQLLEKAVSALPEDLRETFVLAVIEENSHLECAEILKTTPKTIEMRVYRARKKLIETLSFLNP